MRFSHRAPTISGRITRMNLLVSGSVLILAVLAFFSYDMLSFRQSLINNLRSEAQIIGANSVSALVFDDPASAAATLQGLNRSPDIISAVLTMQDGSVFATYGTDELRPISPPSTCSLQTRPSNTGSTGDVCSLRTAFSSRDRRSAWSTSPPG